MSLHLRIITPEGVIYDDSVDAVSVPTTDGEVTIHPNHTHMISVLATGELRVHKGEQILPHASSGGIMEVSPDRVTVLADSTIPVDLIDQEAVQKAYERADAMLQEKRREADIDYVQVQIQIERELNKLKVAKKWR